MEPQESVFSRNGRTLAIAAVVAGAAGGVVNRLLEGQQTPSRQERLQRAIDDLTRKAEGTSLVELVKDLPSTAKFDLEGSVRTSKRRRKLGRKQKAVKVSGASFGDYMRETLRSSADRVGESLQEAIDETTKSLGHYAEEIGATSSKTSRQQRKKLRKQAEKARGDAGARAREQREELMKLGKTTKGKTEDRLHELEGLARETLDKRVKPSLEKATTVAAMSAAEAKKRLAEEAKVLEKRYEKAKPKIEKSAEEYTHRAAELTTELRHAAGERAHDAEKVLAEGTQQARHLAQGAEKALAEGTQQARHLAQEAGTSAKEGTKDFSSLMVWLGIAGGIAYLVFLNDEQKQKARELAKSAFYEGRAIYQDIRGENADFTAA